MRKKSASTTSRASNRGGARSASVSAGRASTKASSKAAANGRSQASSTAVAPTPSPSPAASASQWVSNTTLADAAKFLRKRKRVLIVTHGKPDGDAVGATVALARSLALTRIQPMVWYVAPIPRWVLRIAFPLNWRELPADAPLSQVALAEAEAADGVVILDTGSWVQIGEQRAAVAPRVRDALVIDHHLHGDAEIASRRWIDTGAAAASEIIAPLCCELLGVAGPAQLPADVAEPLYLGLGTDTGWFRFSNVRPVTLRLAADLIETGVVPTRLYELVEQQDAASRWRLLARALSSLELHNGNRIAVMTLTRRDFELVGADRNDTPGFADMPLTIASVRVSAVLTESETRPGEPPLTKISIRSKPGASAVDVAALTQALGGGGHARAAGVKLRMAPHDAKAALLRALM